MIQPEATKLHFNVPQLMFNAVQANTTVCIWARNTGKSEGPMALGTENNIFTMPRAQGLLLGSTYEQLLTRTLPGLSAGWERLGYHRGIHYEFGSFLKNCPKHPRAPLKPDHYVHWFNGAGAYMVSQDRPYTINGVRAQWMAGDEAKTLNQKKLNEEALPTLGGEADKYQGLSNYLSILFCTDMPSNPKSKWLLDYKAMMDPRTIDLILMVQAKIMILNQQLVDASESVAKKLQAEITKFLIYLNELRKDTVYFSVATTFDNIHSIGLDPIKRFKRDMRQLEYDLTVLNKEILKVEKCFYALLDEEVHGYTMANYAYIDTLGYNTGQLKNKDCRWDGDINPDLPLDIGCDYNNAINCVVTGQNLSTEVRYLSSKYVVQDGMLDDCIKEWNDYYKYHRTKVVNYAYDHTANGTRANSNFTLADEWTSALVKYGWKVNRVYLGVTPLDHHHRYLVWNKWFKGDDKRFKKFVYNKENCKQWQISCQLAEAYQSGNEIKKSKKSEQSNQGLPEESTHISEAGDTLMMYYMRSMFASKKAYEGIITN